MTRERSPLISTASVAGVALLIGVVVAFTVARFPLPHHGPPNELLVTTIRVQLLIATFDLVVLIALAGSYVTVYRELPNKYTRNLVVLSFALLFYAFTSNPVVPLLFGFPPRPDLGPFLFLPNLFVSVAVVVLLYQSQA